MNRIYLTILAIVSCTPSRDPAGSTSSEAGTSAEATTGPADPSTSTGATMSPGSSSGGATTGDQTTDEGSASSSGASTGEGSSSTEPATCGDGIVNGAEQCDDGNLNPGDNCTTACTTAACGDGFWKDDEECDDGNAFDGDGCSSTCFFELWAKPGVSMNVQKFDLHRWTECWSDDYAGDDLKPVAGVALACTKAKLLVTCVDPNNPTVLPIVAYASRQDVLTPVDYLNGERHEANGVAWYWAPDQGYIGFAPAGNTVPCTTPGEQKQLCWRTDADVQSPTFSYGSRCALKLDFTKSEANKWRRVVYEAD